MSVVDCAVNQSVIPYFQRTCRFTKELWWWRTNSCWKRPKESRRTRWQQIRRLRSRISSPSFFILPVAREFRKVTFFFHHPRVIDRKTWRSATWHISFSREKKRRKNRRIINSSAKTLVRNIIICVLLSVVLFVELSLQNTLCKTRSNDFPSPADPLYAMYPCNGFYLPAESEWSVGVIKTAPQAFVFLYCAKNKKQSHLAILSPDRERTLEVVLQLCARSYAWGADSSDSCD